jgi:hypothetical protein
MLLFGASLLGMAAACRSSSMFFAPVLCYTGILLSEGFRERIALAVNAFIAFLIGMSPHLVLSVLCETHGKHAGNAANLLIKYKYHYVWDEIPWNITTADLLADLRDNAAIYAWSAIGDIWDFTTSGLARAIELSNYDTINYMVEVILVALVIDSFRRNAIFATTIALGVACYGILLAITFETGGRFSLPILPLITLLLTHYTQTPFRKLLSWVVTLLALASHILNFSNTLGDFREAHRFDEIPAIEQIAKSRPGPTIALTIWLPSPIKSAICIPTAMHMANLTGSEYWRKLDKLVDRFSPDYVVFGRNHCAEMLRRMMSLPLPSNYKLLRDDDVVVISPLHSKDLRLSACSLESDADSYIITFSTPPEVAADQILGGWILALSPQKEHITLPTKVREGSGPVTFSVSLPKSYPLLKGAWKFTSALLLKDGARHEGPIITHDFPQ